MSFNISALDAFRNAQLNGADAIANVVERFVSAAQVWARVVRDYRATDNASAAPADTPFGGFMSV